MAKNILLISIDNLRYDCIGMQPDKRELVKHDVLKHLETPNLDKIAEKGVGFTRCISTNTYTTASHASLFTGLYPPRHGVRSFYETKLSKDVYTMAEVLKVFGYETVMLTDTPDLFYPLGMGRGFDHLFHNDDRALLAFLGRNRGKKLFVFAHFFDVHEPFLLSKNSLYDNRDYAEEIERLYRFFDCEKKRAPGDSKNASWMRLMDHLGNKDHQVFFPLFVRGVSKFDKGRFGDFMTGLGETGFAEGCLTVICSDHGEGKTSLDNPESFGHGGLLFDSVLRVPLIIRHNDLSSRVRDDVVSIVDIFPTVLEFALGVRTGDLLPYTPDGINLDAAELSEEREVYSEVWRTDHKSHAIPRTFVSSFLLQRGVRGRDGKRLINGTPEVFSDADRLGRMSDEEFVQLVFRGLLCRFEKYEDYTRELGYLKQGKNTRNQLLKTMRESLSSVAMPSFVTYDLARDPFEEHPVTVGEDPAEVPGYAQKIYGLGLGSPKTEEVFDDSNVLKRIADKAARLESKSILEALNNKHIFCLIIDDFVKSHKDLTYDRVSVEHQIMESEAFSRFLLERLKYPQGAGMQNVGEDEAEKELEMIKNSLTWRIAQGAITLFDTKLFPPGSKRRGILSRFVLDPLAGRGQIDPFSDSLDGSLVQRIKSAPAGKRALVITYEVPQFDKYSGAHRFFNLLRVLRELGFSVTVLSDSAVVRTNYSEPVADLGVEIVYGQSRFRHLKELGGFFDYVVLHTPSTAMYIDLVRRYFQKAFVIFDTSDLHYVRFEREGEVTGNTESLRKARDYKQTELSLAKKSDAVFVVSEAEGAVLARDGGNIRIEIVPNIHFVKSTSTPFERRRDIMFIGAFAHTPNADAVLYFIREIFPAVSERLDVNFYIIGKNPPQELLSLQSPNIIATGYVPNITPYFEKCRLMVAPLRYGAGVKGKLTQSMSMGLPFVTTTIGAEGMDLQDRRHCFVADDPAAFAERVVNLYTEKELWETFRENSLLLARERFSYETVKNRLREFFEERR
jgi:arylsulfatase A-like enzyme/glycosyltransferase involved in cell wall biosynthesis